MPFFHHFTKGTNFCDLQWATFKGDFSPREANNFLTVKILKFGTPQTIAIVVLKLVKFDVTLH